MAIETTSKPPVLSLPRDIFAALQPRQFLQAHLSPPSKSDAITRPNGRKPTEWRKPTINTNSLTHCHGSAVVRCGDTAVVCGVRGEILLNRDAPNPVRVPAEQLHESEDDGEEIANLGLLVPNIELATGSTPANIPGQAPSSLAQTITDRLVELLHVTKLVRVKDLRILHKPELNADEMEEEEEESREEIVAYWTLYLDVLFISIDGSALDAAWLAILTALRTTLLPKAWWDADLEMVVCSDVVAEATKLDLRGLPIPGTLAVFEGQESGEEKKTWVLAEPDSFEEGLCRETVTVTVDWSEGSQVKLKRLEKAGGSALSRELIKDVVALAGERWKECRDVIVQGTG